MSAPAHSKKRVCYYYDSKFISREFISGTFHLNLIKEKKKKEKEIINIIIRFVRYDSICQ